MGRAQERTSEDWTKNYECKRMNQTLQRQYSVRGAVLLCVRVPAYEYVVCLQLSSELCLQDTTDCKVVKALALVKLDNGLVSTSGRI